MIPCDSTFKEGQVEKLNLFLKNNEENIFFFILKYAKIRFLEQKPQLKIINFQQEKEQGRTFPLTLIRARL